MGRPKKRVEDRQPAEHFRREMTDGLVPVMNEALALVYAKLLTVGCPPVRAVIYVVPSLNETEPGREAAKKVARQWAADVHVLKALASINGGDWQDLPPEKRYQLALDKNLGEAAFHLWTVNFGDVEHREGLEKMKMAREMLKAALGQRPDDSDPMQAFARFALDLAKEAATSAARGKKSPQTQDGGLDRLLNQMPEQKM